VAKNNTEAVLVQTSSQAARCMGRLCG